MNLPVVSQQPTIIDRVLLWGLGGIIAFAPLPLASNRLWSWSLLGVWIGALLLLWSTGGVSSLARRAFAPRSLIAPSLLFASVVGVVGLQASCWIPVSWQHSFWELAESLPTDAACPAVTIDPYATWTSLARLLTYGGAFWLALQIGRLRAQARLLMQVVALTTAIYAAYGLGLHFAGLELILWYEKWAYPGAVTGTFVNRNAFAAFTGMGAVANLGILVHDLFAAHSDRRLSLWQGAHSTFQRVLTQQSLSLAGLVLCATAVVLTASRAGFAATCLGLTALLITAGVHHRTKWHWRAGGAAVAVGFLILVVAAGGSTLIDRLGHSSENLAGRAIVIGATVDGAVETPWLGVGYGTFEDAWPFYRPPGINAWFRQAHSTYAENLLELGVPAMAALVLVVLWILCVCCRGLVLRRRDGIYPSVAIAGSLVPIVHSTIDFSLQIPAVVLTMSVLLGIGFAQSFPTPPAVDRATAGGLVGSHNARGAGLGEQFATDD